MEISKLSEMSLITAMKNNLISWAEWCAEINRRISNGEYVHPYNAKCAKI